MNRIMSFVAAIALLAPGAVAAQDPVGARVKRGEYLVTIGSCHDCHTPLMMGPGGPEPDMKRALSGTWCGRHGRVRRRLSQRRSRMLRRYSICCKQRRHASR